MLTFPTRDHDALVIPANGLAKVVKTPDKAPFEQATTMKAAGKLDADGTSNSRLTFTFRGDAEVLIRTVLRQVFAGAVRSARPESLRWHGLLGNRKSS